MKIGIDISQTAYQGTGVANYTKNLVRGLLKIDIQNEYVLFYSSPRKTLDNSWINGLTSSRIKIKKYRFPPTLLDFLWNRLHVLPIEWLIGKVDVFLTSDWLEPPTISARKVTTIHDLIVYKHPEGLAKKIIEVQKRKLAWVKKEADLVICDSWSTKKDAIKILGISSKKLRMVYPGGVAQ